MKNIMKLCLVLVLCLSLLMVMGCSKKSEEEKTPQTTGGQENNGADESLPIVVNPEGDPFEDLDAGAEDEPVVEGPDETEEATEPPVGIDEDTGEEEGSDFEVDFGDLT